MPSRAPKSLADRLTPVVEVRQWSWEVVLHQTYMKAPQVVFKGMDEYQAHGVAQALQTYYRQRRPAQPMPPADEAFYPVAGKPSRRITRTSWRAEPMGANKGQGGVYLRGETYWIRYSHRGEKHRESSQSTRRSDAVGLLQTRLAEIHGGHFTPAARVTTVAVILDLVMADYRAQGRRSLPRCELACKQVREPLGDTLARDLTYSDMNIYVGACRERGWQPATIWYNLAILRRAYTLARKEGLLSTRPEFPVITVDNARQGFYERADFEKVRAELRSETAKNVVTFAYLTGWRTRSEILPLTWDRVNFRAGVVRLDVRQSKNGKGRTFPFDAMPELQDVLGRQKLAADAFEAMHGWRPQLVFFHQDGDRGGAAPGSPVRTFDKAWRAACKRVGLSGRILHDFRRTAVRNLVRAGVSESVAMQLCGHKTRKIFDRYSIVSERDLREGVVKLAAQAEREQVANG